MNDDPTSSFAARQRATEPDANHEQVRDQHGAEEVDESSTASQQESERKERRKAGLIKKLQFMSHLQKSLDAIVFAYLCTLYYME